METFDCEARGLASLLPFSSQLHRLVSSSILAIIIILVRLSINNTNTLDHPLLVIHISLVTSRSCRLSNIGVLVPDYTTSSSPSRPFPHSVHPLHRHSQASYSQSYIHSSGRMITHTHMQGMDNCDSDEVGEDGVAIHSISRLQHAIVGLTTITTTITLTNQQQ